MKTDVSPLFLLIFIVTASCVPSHKTPQAPSSVKIIEKSSAKPNNRWQEGLNNEELLSCKKLFKKTRYQKINPSKICPQLKQKQQCQSVKGLPIYHYEKIGASKSTSANRILVISLIHGDEVPSGLVSYSWIQRLIDLDPRNSWLVIPMANPDGFFKRTRYNANGVDINRNFPTADWEEKAVKRWETVKKSDPRKFPGKKANNQPETQCLVQHIQDFKPNFIISIHTPLGVLDFDGPKNLSLPKFKPLPWISLGNYPGSLGRYMWKERGIPVLTIELNNELAVYNLEKFDKLQDISGTVAIQAIKKSKPIKKTSGD